MMKRRRSHRRRSYRRRDSGYVLPIVCISLLTLLSAVMITLFISVILSSEEVPPMTSASRQSHSDLSAPDSQPHTSEPGSATVSADPTVTTASQPPQTTSTETPITTAAPTTAAPQTTTAPITTTAPVTTSTAPVTQSEFKADLGAYMPYIDPTGDRWDDAYLMLVNVDHRLEPNQEKSYPILGGLTAFSDSEDYDYRYSPALKMNENAMKALSAMFLEAEANGIEGLDITSAYRSYSRQSTIFQSNCDKTYHWLCADDGCATDWIGKDSKCPLCGKRSSDNSLPITQEEKEANVATYSCAPGTSDHQTGLAVDVVDTTLPSRFNQLIQEYGETESGKWLAENCWKFGFVLRFPPDKEESTGIIYEPWHFRFVGRTHAEKMHELNMCLEEYSAYLESTGYFD